MKNSVAAETTARLLYGSKGRVCNECAEPYVEWDEHHGPTKVCLACEHILYRINVASVGGSIREYLAKIYVKDEKIYVNDESR